MAIIIKVTAIVHYDRVRVHAPDGGVLDFVRLTDTELEDSPIVVVPTSLEHLRVARHLAVEELDIDRWVTR